MNKILEDSIDEYSKRYKKATGVYKIRGPFEEYTMSYNAALHLLARSKFTFLSVIDEDKKGNAYACYILVRAYFETCMALGYLTIKASKYIQENPKKIFEISERILQGGKYFPTDKYLKQIGRERVKAINIYDYIDEVDKDITSKKSEGKSLFNSHREMYDTVLSEFGHPNHLGLSICSSLEKENYEAYKVIDLDRSNTKEDRENYFVYLSWGSIIFFYYWKELTEIFKMIDIDLPNL